MRQWWTRIEAARLADSLMMSAASWSVYEEIYGRHHPARSRVFVLCLLVLKTIWYSKKRCTCTQSSYLKFIFFNSVSWMENDTLLSRVFCYCYFLGLCVIKRSLSRIPSVLCSDGKKQFWLSKSGSENPSRNRCSAIQSQSTTAGLRGAIARPLPCQYCCWRRKKSLSGMAHKAAVIFKIEGNQHELIAIWRKFVITIPAFSLDVRIVSLAGQDFSPAAHLPATIRSGGWIWKVGVHGWVQWWKGSHAFEHTVFN